LDKKLSLLALITLLALWAILLSAIVSHKSIVRSANDPGGETVTQVTPPAVIDHIAPPDPPKTTTIHVITYTVSGRIQDVGSGESLHQATVRVGNQEATSKNGRYEWEGLQYGARLQAFAEGYHPSAVITWWGQTTQDFRLRPMTTTIRLLDAYTGQPIAGARVEVEGRHVEMSTPEGCVVMNAPALYSMIYVTKDGYAPLKETYHGSSKTTLRLRPNVLYGKVTDEETGEPISGTLALARIEGTNPIMAYADGTGRFLLRGVPEHFNLLLKAPGYRRFKTEIARKTTIEAKLTPFEARGVYIPFGLLTREDKVREVIELVERTELNTIVVDVKGDRAWLAYPSHLPIATQIDAYADELNLMDLKELLRLCHEKDIYVIARIVVFKDHVLAQGRPDLAVHREDGSLYQDLERLYWADPFQKEVWEYNVGVAKEVIALGFDEVQFDYLRFPSDGKISDTVYARESNFESRTETMRAFCRYLHDELEPTGAFFSADIFGLTIWVDDERDLGIGQRIADIAPYFDYLSPMVYPSTFEKGNLDYQNPALHPYEVVYRSCQKAMERTHTKIRPWLQHYSLYGVIYDTREMLAQKKAAEDASACGWLFWNAGAKYDEAVFRKEP